MTPIPLPRAKQVQSIFQSVKVLREPWEPRMSFPNLLRHDAPLLLQRGYACQLTLKGSCPVIRANTMPEKVSRVAMKVGGRFGSKSPPSTSPHTDHQARLYLRPIDPEPVAHVPEEPETPKLANEISNQNEQMSKAPQLH